MNKKQPKKTPASKNISKKTDSSVKQGTRARTSIGPGVTDVTSAEKITYIALADIDLGENYRRYYDQETLAEFAAAIKSIGMIISPVTLRPIGNRHYQLVVGFRRYFGANLAGLTVIPAIIRDLTGDQVEEIQLQENIQREDPHPVHEADALAKLYGRRMSTEDIALKLGKPINWVYRRRKLSELIPEIQEMFLADVFTVSQAYDIADLATEAQQGFFKRFCSSWKTNRPYFNRLQDTLSQFQGNLKSAAFDVTDGALVRAAGSCLGCRFNTAYEGLLIPNLSGEARCTKVSCFESKYQAYLTKTITLAITTGAPAAIIIYGEMPEPIKKILEAIPGAPDLPVYQSENVTVIGQPEKPDADDYLEYDDDDAAAPTVNQVACDAAIDAYNDAMTKYGQEISSARALKGLYLSSRRQEIVYYYPVPSGSRQIATPSSSIRHIKDMIATDTDTAADLRYAIENLQRKEVRSQELDREKLQNNLNDALREVSLKPVGPVIRTDRDEIADRWLILDSVTPYLRDDVRTLLNLNFDYKTDPKAAYEALGRMTTEEVTLLSRLSLASKSDSKLPNSIAGYFLREVAVSAGVDCAAIQDELAKKAQIRKANMDKQVQFLEKRLLGKEGKQAA